MSAYFVAKITIHDDREYRRYLDSCDEVFARYSGRYLAVDPEPDVLEGAWDCTRTVLIEFPDEAELRRWYESEDYRRILRHRLAGADCDAVLLHGR